MSCFERDLTPLAVAPSQHLACSRDHTGASNGAREMPLPGGYTGVERVWRRVMQITAADGKALTVTVAAFLHVAPDQVGWQDAHHLLLGTPRKDAHRGL